MEKYQIEGVPMEVYTKFKEKLNSPSYNGLQIFKDWICNDEDKTREENIKDTKELHRLHILQAIISSQYAKVEFAHGSTLHCMSGFVEQEGRFPTIDDDIRIIRGDHYFAVAEEYIISEVGFEIVRKKK